MMYEPETLYLPSSLEGQRLHTLVWQPEGAPRAAVILVHGMAEHIGRYDEFARYLCANGMAVIGASHLGHGLTAQGGQLGYIADRDGDKHLVADVDVVRRAAEQRWPDVPCFIIGHSMGSFLTRYYLCTEKSKGLAGAIITGTADQPRAALNAALFITGVQKLFGMKKKPGRLLNSISFGSYNKGFDPPLGGGAWLSKNEADLEHYAADPTCGFCFTVGAFADMFRVMKFIGKRKNIRRMDRSMPLLLTAGELDPVGDKGAGVRRVYKRFKAAGIRDVEMKLYPGDRHEILNELDREVVFADMLGFIERTISE